MIPLPDFQPSGNQGRRPDLYELENRALDPSRAVLDAMREIADWTDRDLVDLGCGSGFWLTHYVGDPRARVLRGSAEHIPLPDACVDVVHARFAYFFPPGCEAGLTEVMRVLRPGGTLVVVNNDQRAGEFATLLKGSAWAAPQGQADATDNWWAERCARRTEVMSSWLFDISRR